MLVQVYYKPYLEDDSRYVTIYQGKEITGRVCHKEFGTFIKSYSIDGKILTNKGHEVHRKGRIYNRIKIMDIDPCEFHPYPWTPCKIKFKGNTLPVFQEEYIGRFEIDNGITDSFYFCDTRAVKIIAEWCIDNKVHTQYLFDKYRFTNEEATLKQLKKDIRENNQRIYLSNIKWALLAEEIIRVSEQV